jgi:hypothetical protein
MTEVREIRDEIRPRVLKLVMAALIERLHVDWKKNPQRCSYPLIVPPLAMKPIICTEYLDRWYQVWRDH